MKSKTEAITPSCALCAHATFLPSDNAITVPPLRILLTADATEENMRILCPHQKDADPFFSCRRFSFDPLKYRPKKAPPLGSLDEDSLLLD